MMEEAGSQCMETEDTFFVPKVKPRNTNSVIPIDIKEVYDLRMPKNKPPKPKKDAVLQEWVSRGMEKDDKKRSNTELAKLLGVQQPRIAEIKSGDRRVQASELAIISEYIDEPIPPEILPSGVGMVTVPIISWVSAGKMLQSDVSEIEVGRTIAAGLEPGEWIALRVEGDSMNRVSPENSIILVNRKEKALVSGKLFVIADHDGSATYKRFRAGPPPHFVADSSQSYDPIFFDQEPLVVGRVRRTVLEH